MGHSVNSVVYRLNFYKHWRIQVVLCQKNFFLNEFYLYYVLGKFFEKFFWFSSLFYSHFLIKKSGFNKVKVIIFVYDQFFQTLVNFFFFKSKLNIFNIFLNSFGGFDLNLQLFENNNKLSRSYFYYFQTKFLKILQNFLEREINLMFNTDFFFQNIFNVNFVNISQGWHTPFLLSRFFVFKLKKRQSISKIVNSFLKLNYKKMSKGGVLGIYVKGSGRFTRSQRASSFFVQKGKVPFSSLSVFIDYFELPVYLKYGACSLKIWVAYNVEK